MIPSQRNLGFVFAALIVVYPVKAADASSTPPEPPKYEFVDGRTVEPYTGPKEIDVTERSALKEAINRAIPSEITDQQLRDRMLSALSAEWKCEGEFKLRGEVFGELNGKTISINYRLGGWLVSFENSAVVAKWNVSPPENLLYAWTFVKAPDGFRLQKAVKSYEPFDAPGI